MLVRFFREPPRVGLGKMTRPNNSRYSQLMSTSGLATTAKIILVKSEKQCDRAALGTHLIIGGRALTRLEKCESPSGVAAGCCPGSAEGTEGGKENCEHATGDGDAAVSAPALCPTGLEPRVPTTYPVTGLAGRL